MHISSLLGALSPLLTGETSAGHMVLIEPGLVLPGPASAPLEAHTSTPPIQSRPADPDPSNPALQEAHSFRKAGHNPTAQVGIAITPTKYELEHTPVVFDVEVSAGRGDSVTKAPPGAWTQFEARQAGSENLFAEFVFSGPRAQSSVSVEQIGSDSKIAGSQAGERNLVFIAQIGDLHSATIAQSGRNNDLVLVQQISTNRAALLQSGTDGTLTLAQEGQENKADIMQLSAHNFGKFHQWGSENQILVRQSGEANSISVSQKGLGQFVEIIQASGSRNSVSVVQNSDFSVATVSQIGAANFAQVIQ